MRAWIFLLGGLIVWTAHFFGSYVIASIFLDTTLSRVLALVLTMLALAANALLLFRAVSTLRGGGLEEVSRWSAVMAAWVAGLSFVAVLWQGLPALLA